VAGLADGSVMVRRSARPSTPPAAPPVEAPSSRPSYVSDVALVGVALLATLTSGLFLWWTNIPLGIIGEWTWDRHKATLFELLFGPGGLIALVVGGVWLTWMWAGDRRIVSAMGMERILWWTGAVVLGGAWYATVIGGTPFPHGSGRAVWVLFYPGPSGYYTEARGGVDRRQFLATYRARVERGDDVLHIGTHPPGLVAAYWVLDDLRQTVPGLDRTLAATLPDEVREWWGLIDEQTRLRGGTVPQDDERLLWLAALVVGLFVVLGMLPLAWLIAREYGTLAAWRCAGLIAAVPALVVFWPKSDALLAGVSITLCALWVYAWDQRGVVGAIVGGGIAGAWAWGGINLTLGLLPTLVWLGVWTLAEVWRGEGSHLDRVRAGLWRVVPGGTGFVAVFSGLTCVIWWLFDLALPWVWLANLRNHAGFYDVYPRSFAGWLLVNPWELALSLGGPIVVCAVWSVVARGAWRSPMVVATLVVAALLWMSGKNSGEAARLWEFQSGWWLIVAAPCVTGCPVVGSPDREHAASGSRVWLWLWGLQWVACVATAWRVAGFHVPGQ
jgi:methylthioxylose transferase